MRWLASRRWWLLAGAVVLLLLGLMQSWTLLSSIPVVVVLLLLLISIPAGFIARHTAPRPPRSNWPTTLRRLTLRSWQWRISVAGSRCCPN